MTQGKIDKERVRERDEKIKKILALMDSLQTNMKETYGVFRIQRGSYSGDSKSGVNQGCNFRRNEEGFHSCYS